MMRTRKFEFINHLIHTLRWSGKLMLKDESVSDHILGMNELAIEFVDGITTFDEVNKRELLKDLIYRNSIHDYGESLYTDIPRTFKYKTPELANLINSTEDEMMKESMPGYLYEDCQSAKSKSLDDLNGFCVSVFDVVQAGVKMRSEIMLGNKYFEREILNSLGLMNEYMEIVMKDENYLSSPIKVRLVTFIIEYLDYLTDYKN